MSIQLGGVHVIYYFLKVVFLLESAKESLANSTSYPAIVTYVKVEPSLKVIFFTVSGLKNQSITFPHHPLFIK